MSNQLKRDQQRQKELAYMRKVKQTMQPKSTEERRREIEREQSEHPRTGSSRVSDFLYRNKFKIILALIALVIAGVSLYSCLIRPSFDTKVLVVYTTESLETERYESILKQYGYDLDGNGKVEYQILDVCLSEDQGGQAEIAQRSSFSAYLQLGDANLYLLDEKIYNELKEQSDEVFADLSEQYPDVPGVDGDRFLFAESAVGEEIGDRRMPDGFCAVLRARKDAESSESYQNAARILDNLIRGEKTN